MKPVAILLLLLPISAGAQSVAKMPRLCAMTFDPAATVPQTLLLRADRIIE